MSHDYKIIKNQIVAVFETELSEFIFDESNKPLEKLNIKDIIRLSNTVFITGFKTNDYNKLNFNEFIDILNSLEQSLYYEQKHFIEYSKLADKILEIVQYGKSKSSFYNEFTSTDLPNLLKNYHIPQEKKEPIKKYLIDVLDSIEEIEAFFMNEKIQQETISQLLILI